MTDRGILRPAPNFVYFEGSPEGAVTADFNTIGIDQATNTLFRKATADGATGWQQLTLGGKPAMADHFVSYPPADDTPGAPGDYSVDPASGHRVDYTGDGVSHSWGFVELVTYQPGGGTSDS